MRLKLKKTYKIENAQRNTKNEIIKSVEKLFKKKTI